MYFYVSRPAADASGKDYTGKHFGFMRQNGKWIPAFTTTREEWYGGIGTFGNTISLVAGEGLFFQRDSDGVIRPYWKKVLGRKEINVQDWELENRDNTASSKNRNGLNDFILLSDEDQEKLFEHFASIHNILLR